MPPQGNGDADAAHGERDRTGECRTEHAHSRAEQGDRPAEQVNGAGGEDEQEIQFNPRNEKGEDVSEVIGIREYKQGDHPKRIHWKLSSKKKQIMIKEYGEESDDERIIDFSMLCPRGECTYDWYDEKLEELVNTSWTLLMNHLVPKVRWYNPTGEYTELSEIKKIEDIGFMVEQVIRAGVGETEERELENDGEKDICVKN